MAVNGSRGCIPAGYPKYTDRSVADVLRVDPAHPDAATIARAADALRTGRLVAFPTETVYGLGANALMPEAVARVFSAKDRPASDPLIVHVPGLDAVASLVEEIPATARLLAQSCWPGPLTLILRRGPVVSDAVTAGRPGVAIRVPAHPVALALVSAAGVPIVAPSANLFSRPSPTRAEHVLTDLGAVVDVIVDAGPTPIGVESTIVDLTTTPPTVLRPGGISIAHLQRLLPDLVAMHLHVREGEAAPAPGTLLRHYAPATPLTLYEGTPEAVLARVTADARRVAGDGQAPLVMGPQHLVQKAQSQLTDMGNIRFLDLGGDTAADIAPNLYDRLRTSDTVGASRIFLMQVDSTDDLSEAVRDRLRRASSGDVVTCLEHPPGSPS